jgi:hypothetical protein
MTIYELLNEIARTNIIYKHKRGKINSKFTNKVSIFETISREILENHELMIKSYKTNKLNDNDKNDEDEFKQKYKDGHDRRRIIMKNIDGMYNYIPIQCEDHPYSSEIDPSIEDCIFAHNEYEINFHSVVYHTKICLKKNCHENTCPNSHGLNEEFRKIYDHLCKEIIDLSLKIEESELFKNFLIHYDKIIPIPVKFSLDTFKVLPCRLLGMCDKDKHLCFNYHEEEEKRRPPNVFEISNEICNMAMPD